MKFKLNDRVIFYTEYNNTHVHKGTIVSIFGNDLLKIKHDEDGYPVVHYKQCRKLVKKERRRMWVEFFAQGIDQRPILYFDQPNPISTSAIECVEFIEVRKKK